MSFVSLGRYIPKYFILFIAMVNGIVSLISLSVFSLLVYRNARISVCWFYILQLYYIHWLALVIFCGVFRVFCVEDHVICKQWEFYFFFSNLDSFYFFFCWGNFYLGVNQAVLVEAPLSVWVGWLVQAQRNRLLVCRLRVEHHCLAHCCVLWA